MSCRALLRQVNTDWGRNPEKAPPSLTDAERRFLGQHFGLDRDESIEVESDTFTELDAHYLDQCYLFRDAARALGVAGLPPQTQATAGFAWVVRQVRLTNTTDVCPPQFVLRRGWGNPIERALVFLALLDQLGLDGGLVCLPAKGEAKALRVWAVGIRGESEVWLFEPGLGWPLPAPGKVGIATLAQARSIPNELLHELTGGMSGAYEVAAKELPFAEVRLTTSLPALSARMRALGPLLSAAQPARLADSPRERQQRLERVAGQPSVSFWQPAAAGDNPARLLARFLPPEEGGHDRVAPAEQRLWKFRRELVPEASLPQPIRALEGEPGLIARDLFNQPFTELTMTPKQARDLLLRGRLDESARKLVQLRDQARQIKERLKSEPDVDARLVAWCGELKSAHAALREAERRAAREKSSAAQMAVEPARQRLFAVVQKSEPVVLATAEALAAEATYLLALCKHEQAERHQPHFERQRFARAAGLLASSPAAGFPGRIPWPALAALAVTEPEHWRSAAEWWKVYLEEHPSAPGTVAARFARARAMQMLGDHAAAKTVLQQLGPEATELDRLAARLKLQAASKPR